MSAPTNTKAATHKGGGQVTLPQLCWWREAGTLPASRAVYALLRTKLMAIAVLGEPRWHHAVAGDAAEAISLALRISNKGFDTPLTLDLAGTALLLCAIDGSVAARVTLHHLRRRFSSLRLHKRWEG